MRASIAVIAAVAGIASAVPHYGYGAYEPSSAAPVYTPEPYPAYPPVETPVTPSSSAAEEYPVSTPAVYPPTTPSETPAVPEYPEETTTCESSTTITVTVPYPSGTGYPPVSPPASTPVAPYPTGPAYPPAPYPTGTGAYPAPPAGTASSSGYVKPSPSSYPPEFTGAASHFQVGGFVAGVGAFAAFFL